MRGSSPASPTARRGLRALLVVAALLTLATVAMGSVVAATDSSAACPAWPQCYPDRIRPDVRIAWLENPAIEMFHRAVSGLCLLTLLLSGLAGRRQADRRLRVLPWVALVGAVLAAVFGMMTVLWSLPLPLAMLDVGGSLVALMAIVTAAAAAHGPASVTTPGPAARRALLAACLLVTMHVLGVLVAGSTSDGYRSFTRVVSWPVWRIVAVDHSPALQMTRWVLAVLAALLIALTVLGLQRRSPRWAALLGVLTGLEIVLSGAISVRGLADAQTSGLTAPVAVLYAVTAVVIVAVLAVPATGAIGFGTRPDAGRRRRRQTRER